MLCAVGWHPLDPLRLASQAPPVFSCSVSSVSRASGHSAAAAAAYHSHTVCVDPSGVVHDYTARDRTSGVVAMGFAHTAHDSPAEFAAALDAGERRKDAKVARSVVLALPHSTNDRGRRSIVEGLAEAIGERWDVPVMWCIHRGDHNEANDHVHFLLGTRDSQGAKVRRLDVKQTAAEEVEWLRRAAQVHIESKVGTVERRTGRWDHRSYQRRGLPIQPMMHEGSHGKAKRRAGRPDAIARANDAIRAEREAVAKAQEQAARAQEEAKRREADQRPNSVANIVRRARQTLYDDDPNAAADQGTGAGAGRARRLIAEAARRAHVRDCARGAVGRSGLGVVGAGGARRGHGRSL